MPTLETINVGLAPNDKKGDPLRDAMQKVILNFSALNTAIQGVLDTKGQANGFASLDGNGRLLAAQAPLVYAAVLPTSAHDLNDFIAPGTYHQNTNVGAATGTHYPTPYAGLLLVRASATNFLYQFYTRFRSGPGGSQATYWRTFYANVWSDWQEVAKKAELDALSTAVAAAIPLVQKGAANGVASLDSVGHLPAEQAPIMYAAVLPTATHTLNDYVTPGVWYQASIAGATAGGASYPTAQVGFLEVVATGTPVLQVFTTRNATPAIHQRFWRVRVTSTTWSNWKEVVDTTTTLSYVGRLGTAQDLNAYTTRGIWFASAASIATGGSNYPVGTAGFLMVLSESQAGGAAQTSGVSQRYESVNGKVYTRYVSGGVWSQWVTLLDSSVIGVADGVAVLDANVRLPNVHFPLSVSNPAGTDANNLTAPGLYYNNSDAQATAALNWPEQLAGSLFVEAAEVVAGSANQQITQTYTTRNGSGGVMRTYKRVRFGGGAGVWGLWQELARRADAMSHVYLTSATDANTLTADNTWWTAANSSVVSGGANFPPAPVASSFIFTTQAISATYMVQTCMMTPGSNRRPIEYRRIGNGSTTWSGWRIIAPVQLVTDLPIADCGDVYVDGLGWHRWNGTAYALVAPVRAVFQRGPGSGSWTSTVPEFFIDAVAGGGGGGGGSGYVGETNRLNGGGGGAGQSLLGELISAPIGTLVSWTVGAGGGGGAGGTVNNAGIIGGNGTATVITINTSPVQTITLDFGRGGSAGASGGPALGGQGYPNGCAGFAGAVPNQGTWAQTGAGASSPFGGGGAGVANLGGPAGGGAGGGYGSGGGGGASPTVSGNIGGVGGAGRGGFLKIYW